MALARNGDRAGARTVLAGLYDAAAHLYVPPTSRATIHLGLGEIDQMFNFLDHAIDDRDPIIVPSRPIPSLIRFAPIRDSPHSYGK